MYVSYVLVARSNLIMMRTENRIFEDSGSLNRTVVVLHSFSDSGYILSLQSNDESSELLFSVCLVSFGDGSVK